MPEEKKMARTDETLNALKFISPLTLAKVQHLHVHVESWEWVYALDRVLPRLAEHHGLESFKFSFHDALKQTFLKQKKAYPDHTLNMSLSGLAKVRDVKLVEFEVICRMCIRRRSRPSWRVRSSMARFCLS